MCAFCNGSRRVNGRVEYLAWSNREGGTSATNGVCMTAWTQGNSIPCPACEPKLYGPIIVRVELKTERWTTMSGLRDAIDRAASDPRHDCGQLLQAAGNHIDELRHMILRLVDDAHRIHMIGSGYRDEGQAMLYAEAKRLIER